MVVIQLAKLIDDKRMTRSEFAKITGIRPTTISHLCNNQIDFLKLEHINCICKALPCDIGDLLKLTDE